ncbi:hypothetical protein [Bradyrhizobium erythrophlei]|nr:hypothetical protein [Bradyrhizobium erythrophlei]
MTTLIIGTTSPARIKIVATGVEQPKAAAFFLHGETPCAQPLKL